jgi:DHA2 family multidrug resistance protein
MGTLFMTVLGFVLFGSLVLLPLWLQTLLGYPSVQAGEAMSPRGLGSFLAMPIVGMLLAKYDPRKFLAIGISIAALTLWQFSRLNLNAGYWDFFWPQLIQGVSLGFIFVPLTTITMGSIPKEQMGNATSIFNLLRNLGGSFGIASVATLLDRFQQAHLNLLVSHITPYSSQAAQAWEGATVRMWLHGIPLATAQRQGYAAVWGAMQRQAAILTFLDIFRLLALIFVVLIPFVLIMKKPAKPSKTVASH